MFKKPNILRRKIKPNLLDTNPEPCLEQIHIVYTTAEETPAIVKSALASKHKCRKANHKSRIPAQRIMLDSYMCNEYRKRKMQNCNLVEKQPICKSDVIMMSPEDCPRMRMGRVESAETLSSRRSMGRPHTLSSKAATETAFGDQRSTSAFINQFVPSNTRSCSDLMMSTSDSTLITSTSQLGTQDPITGNSSGVMKEIENLEQPIQSGWACTQLPCKQIFNSYDSLAEHLLGHNAEETLQDDQEDISDGITQDSPVKDGQSSYNCPAHLSGEGKRCPRVYCERSQLHTHIREEHTQNDAPFKCEICGRGFFWCTGLRAHLRTHAGTSRSGSGSRSGSSSPRVFACAWPGCARVFTQACRLKEHSRTHTGDRPYSCTFPKCSWSFRTASKLLRHARGHTGDRRHACGQCGRGFLRAEHLREHLPRHAPARPPQHCCPHPGCEQKFSNKSSLYGHQKKHTAEVAQANVQTNEQMQIVSPSFMVHIGDILASTSINPECDQDYHAARTHCPYIRPPSGGGEEGGKGDEGEWGGPPHIRIAPLPDNTESMDGAEHNEFAVQKDLFLHENPLQQDAGQTVECGALLDGMSAAQLEHHLALLDSPPDLHLAHLLQEELLYNDVATDETSFQVLLLSETP